ncbi:hypothetical protein GPECTOR_3g69 [Gonium pectorale]|uniref:PAS domain-containing protein n=1 Tax=Gonium pectorale TaxID=33097 RepID=A0A150GZS0_GONPE|nr:hypothetical protein GPECTOR_3g69 [Gonium pectorale]|eukprot:KXZ55417.1 hypothetical protein GPECTOR_3g69 [Gonium pectorale]
MAVALVAASGKGYFGGASQNGIFGVLFTLSKENSDTRINLKWIIVKAIIDAWQLFTTVISPAKQGWSISSTVWSVVGVLNFHWLGDLGYGAYLAVLYGMVALLAVNVGMCVWVAWCFKEQKFPVVWPIKVLRVFSSVFFQAFDVTSLSLLQLGISCRYTGFAKPKMQLELFPEYSCMSTPHLLHAVVSALSLVVFVAIALLLNMAEVEVNPKSRRPLALGHSGAEVMVFGIKALLTLVDVFLGWKKVAAVAYLALSLALAYQYLRWSPNLVGWMNHLKSGVSAAIAWAAAMLVLLVFRPGVKTAQAQQWADAVTIVMLAGLAPAFGVGALLSWLSIRRMTRKALNYLATRKPDVPLEDVCRNLDDPRDIEIASRCCRVWRDEYNLEPEAVNRANDLIKAGLAMFPSSAYMVLLHANFMIDVLGVSQSGNARIEEAVKLNPGLMCRFIMFVRQQQATQKAAATNTNGGINMDLLGYVEYQRKQRMVIRCHREALQAMCNFWRALDASNVSFTHLSKALGKIESSVSQAQTAYRVALQSYGNNPKLLRLYGRFLQTVKNDPWGASEYFQEAERLEDSKDGDSGGPLLPDGTPLGRMDELSTSVLVISATGEIQMANRQAYQVFGYKERGTLDGKSVTSLLAPHCSRWLTAKLAELVKASSLAGVLGTQDRTAQEAVLVGMHYDRLAFNVKLTLTRTSGVGEDSQFIALFEPVSALKGVSTLWVASNGTIAACDPQFVSAFGWKAFEVNGASITAFVSVPSFYDARTDGEEDEESGGTPYMDSASDTMARLLAEAVVASGKGGKAGQGLQCLVAQKYNQTPAGCCLSVTQNGCTDSPVYEVHLRLPATERDLLLVTNRKGTILHVTSELANILKDPASFGARHKRGGSLTGVNTGAVASNGPVGNSHNAAAAAAATTAGDLLPGYTLSDFLPLPWREMHPKYLKDTTAMSPPGRGAWACRKLSSPGPTLELRSSTGKPLFMRVSVSTTEMAGEITHVVKMAKSSLDDALAERRLRLTISTDGLITGFGAGTPPSLLGLEPSQVVGRGLWEVVDDLAPQVEGKPPPTPGPRMLNSMVNRSVANPGLSWRVRVAPPAKARSLMSDLDTAARTSAARAAIMHIVIDTPAGESSNGQPPNIYVDLWPISSLSGLMGLDAAGRILSVMEERTRPAGLLFGLPSAELLGGNLADLVALPPGRANPGDLLSLHSTKKSNLKVNKKEGGVKVGPVHILQAVHVDGRPLSLEVQVVGRPGPNQPLTVILRPHAAPMLPTNIMRSAPSLPSPPELPATQSAPPAPISPEGPPLPAGLPLRPGASHRFASHRLSLQPAVSVAKLAGGAAAAGGSTASAPPTPKPGDPALESKTDALWDEIEKAANRLTTSGIVDPMSNVASPGPTMDITITASAVTLSLPTPPEILLSGEAHNALPLPGVTAAKAAAVAGRGKLADLVRSLGPEASGILPRVSSGSERLRARGSSRLANVAGVNAIITEERRTPSRMFGTVEASLPGSAADMAETKDALTMDVGAMGKVDAGTMFLTHDDDESADSDGGNSDNDKRKGPEGAERISTWVASEGAFYQNTAPLLLPGTQSDDEGPGGGRTLARQESCTPGAGVSRRSSIDAFVANKESSAKQPGGDVGGYDDDDARSEGGASQMSGQSGTVGAESGRRFRRLAKLMNSTQAQQVQERLRRRAAGTVGALVVVHIICFVLVVIFIRTQRQSMGLLGRNGEAQRFIQQIMMDVRTMDILSRVDSVPGLYSISDLERLVDRTEWNANQIKIRMNTILEGNHQSESEVMNLLFYTKLAVWDGNALDGSDVYTNITTWEAITRFYAMTMTVVQNHNEWVAHEIHVADTPSGQYILKTGPELYGGVRKVMDALLFDTVDSVHIIDNLQLIFLAIEGCAVSCAAACYLAHLLRAVAAQRLDLYRTFLMIPLGLTRVLASQNTALMLDEDDDADDLDDELADKAAAAMDDDDGAAGNNRRRSVVMLGAEGNGNGNSGYYGGEGRGGGVGGGGPGRGRRGELSSPSGGREDDLGDRKLSDRGLLQSTSVAFRSSPGCWSGFTAWLGRSLGRLKRGGVSPLPLTATMSNSGAGASFNANLSSKRNLKDDSHETMIMLTPFLIWSGLVIAIYITAVLKMKGMIDVVAIHSVVNRISARVYQAVFFAQELAVVENADELTSQKAALREVLKLARDAWLTLELGENAYKAGGEATERFPLVKDGLAFATPALSDLFYGTGICVRQPEHLPCPGPSYRFYQMTILGLDAMMGQFMMAISAMANNKSSVPEGLLDEHFDFAYNLGTVDLTDGTIKMRAEHYEFIVRLFDSILLLHIVLFMLLFVIFAGFMAFMLNPLMKRVVKERRRIAELMSQLPMELDVEKLIARALGTAAAGNASSGGPAPGGTAGTASDTGYVAAADQEGGTSKWRAILRALLYVFPGAQICQ